MKHFFTLSFSLWCFGSLFAQSLNVYLVQNPYNFKEYKKEGFDQSYLSSSIGASLLPPSITDFPEVGSPEASLVLFFLDEEGKEISATEAGFVKASFSERNGDYIRENYEVNHVSITSGTPVTIIHLKAIGHDLRQRTELALEVEFEDGDKEVRWMYYESFPYDEEIENWKSSYTANQTNTQDAWSHLLFSDTWNPMYLTSVPSYNIIQAADTANIPYRPEEAPEGFLIAGNFSMPFTAVRGRDDQVRFWRTAGVYVNSDFSWRIAKNASSSPLVPMNTKAGFGLYKSIITTKDYRYSRTDRARALEFNGSEPFKTLVFDFQFMHYSNGQDSSAHYYNEDSTAYRTDYKSGNFSTNYLKFGVVNNRVFPNLSQLHLGGYARFDMALPGFAEYEEDQIKSYGKQRLELFALWKSPIVRGLWPFRFEDHSTQAFGNVTIPTMVQHSLRLDLDVLLGDLSNYNQHPDGKERRLSMRLRYENQRLTHRSIGYFAQYYLGRDDMNIRYHLWVNYAMVGLTFRFPQDRGNKEFRDQKLQEIYKYYEDYPCDSWGLPCLKSE